ncbi:hypothetical protein [Solihabitans fulvus]|uniref:hypothetical protein n=1 Tax=Solihabitans fulvus TaxID=1892852 RepID=UPI001661DDCA|nr:hypothetical protein [Solihabitans fulvus]
MTEQGARPCAANRPLLDELAGLFERLDPPPDGILLAALGAYPLADKDSPAT